ncbi:MAG: lysophospholipid acyltransferase family protein [Cytophagaceae bacterium]
MIKAKQNKLAVAFFKLYFSRGIKRHFSGFEVRGEVSLSNGKPVLLLCNHYTWWDGPWMYHLTHRYFGKNFYVMMLEETLSKNKILSWAGAFSINKKSRDIINSLDYAGKLLLKPENLLCIFPQGEFESQYVARPKFNKGFLRVLNANTQIILACARTEYFDRKKPLVYIHLKEYEGLHAPDAIEAAFQEHYSRSHFQQLS